jgi:hypothetical protein
MFQVVDLKGSGVGTVRQCTLQSGKSFRKRITVREERRRLLLPAGSQGSTIPVPMGRSLLEHSTDGKWLAAFVSIAIRAAIFVERPYQLSFAQNLRSDSDQKKRYGASSCRLKRESEGSVSIDAFRGAAHERAAARCFPRRGADRRSDSEKCLGAAEANPDS